MKIYAVADIHGRQEKFERVRSRVSELKPDVLVIAGDVTGKTDPSAFLNLMNDFGIPVVAVCGESDIRAAEGLFDRCPNVIAVHLKKTSVNGVSFTGISGVPARTFGRNNSYSDDTIRKVESCIDRETVVVTHLPPWGCFDESFWGSHSGCRRLYELILACQPAALLCGHTHKHPCITYIGKTLVANCSVETSGDGAVIQLLDGEVIRSDLL